MLKKSGYTKSEIAKIVGLNPQTIHHWTVTHILVPNVPTPRGTGHNRLYDDRNILECHMIIRFQMLGFSLEKISKILGFIRLESSKKPIFDFWSDPEINLFYRRIEYFEELDPSRPKVFEDLSPNPNIDVFYFSMKDLMAGAYYCEIIDLGTIKRDILKKM